MREIRFRAWDGARMHLFGNFAETLSYNDISGWNVAPNEPDYKGEWICGESQSKTPLFDLMQFTGLLDANGKEIYEGDIVDLELHQSNRKAKVVWASFRWWFQMIDLDPDGRVRMDWLESKWESRCKVIGHIYENPEL
jgi:hypothetical protein